MKKFMFVVVLAILVLVSVGVVSAQADVTTFDFSWSAFDLCTGEWVDISGTVRLVQSLVYDESGGQHYVRTVIYSHASGVGETSGEPYTLVGAAPASQNFAPGEATSEAHFQFVNSGGGDNLFMSILAHATVNANGDTTVYFENLETSCQ